MARILIIDDDLLIRKSLCRLFKDNGHDVFMADTLSAGHEEAEKGMDVVYLDLDLPDGDGLHAINELSSCQGNPEVIVITGMRSDRAAKKSMESNAWDYISKPASPAEVITSLESALNYRKESDRQYNNIDELDYCGIIGESTVLQRSLQEIGRAAASDAGVLIRGETGVGKELAAKAVHVNSRRQQGPFVVVDCSNLTESLVESILYGHVKGSFTGAHNNRRGLVAEADGGTLFLDEIGELSLELQKSFLRVLQEKRYRPLGSGKELASDFRIVAATNRNLAEMVEAGTFRRDLLYRIQTVEIILPPVRDRGDDLGKLIAHFISTTCDRYGFNDKSGSPELYKVAAAYDWPGNVRELMHVVEAAVIQSGTDPVIYPKHLPGHIRMAFLGKTNKPLSKGRHEGEEALRPASPEPEPIETYSDYKRSCDHRYFVRLLQVAGNDVKKASTLSGLSVASIYRYMANLAIKKTSG